MIELRPRVLTYTTGPFVLEIKPGGRKFEEIFATVYFPGCLSALIKQAMRAELTRSYGYRRGEGESMSHFSVETSTRAERFPTVL
jgi:hypothetical protein